MSKNQHKRSKGWVIWFYTCFVLLFLLSYPVLFVFVYVFGWKDFYFYLRKIGSKILLFVVGVSTVKSGIFITDQSYIYCANHTSFFDIPMLASVLPARSCFLGKAELSKIPLFGGLFRLVEIEVERGSSSGASKAYKKSIDMLEKGYNLIIFPEATTTTGKKLLKFKDGAFKMSVESLSPIVPLTLHDNMRIYPDDGHGKGEGGKSRFTIHDVIDPVDYNEGNVKDLIKGRTFEVIQKELNKEWK